jgi:hypothetical protein
MKPDYLQDVIMPPERIADMAKFKRFTKYYTPEDLVIRSAWHETGHAIGWVLKGGELERATIIPVGDEHEGPVLWGVVDYAIGDVVSWTDEERQLHAFTGLCAPAICELAGIEDPDGTMSDIESAIESLRPLYPEPKELCGQLIKTWIEALEFFATPWVWRTADAFARKLVLEGTIERFPRTCISDDNSPIPGLQDAELSHRDHPKARGAIQDNVLRRDT